MTREELTKKVLDKIKSGKLIPRARWQFLLKRYFIWAFFALAVIVGSIAVAAIIWLLTSDRTFILAREENWLTGLIVAIPYVWLFLLLIFVGVAYYNFKQTEAGYRYHSYLIIFGSIVISLLLGSVIYFAGGGEKIEQLLFRNLPPYQHLMQMRMLPLLDPEEGRLVGVITSPYIDNSFDLRDPNGQHWLVFVESDDFFPSFEFEIANIVPPHLQVVVKGKKISDDEFMATEVQPLLPPRSFRPRANGRVKINFEIK